MDFAVIRRHFKAERKRVKRTQQAVAENGQVEQSAVSKLETDLTYTPQADTFVNAIEGLGMSVSSFFAGIEHGHGPRTAPPLIPPGIGARGAMESANPVSTSEEAVRALVDVVVRLEKVVEKQAKTIDRLLRDSRGQATRARAAQSLRRPGR